MKSCALAILATFDNLLHRRVLHAERNIIIEGIIEQDGLLVHITDRERKAGIDTSFTFFPSISKAPSPTS